MDGMIDCNDIMDGMIEREGERGVGDGSGGQLQAEVFGAKEKNLSVHNIQDRWTASGG